MKATPPLQTIIQVKSTLFDVQYTLKNKRDTGMKFLKQVDKIHKQNPDHSKDLEIQITHHYAETNPTNKTSFAHSI
jgi:hypothetical protein